MRFPLAPDVFPRVQFAKPDQLMLESVVQALVDDTLQQSHAQRQFQTMEASGNDARATFQFQAVADDEAVDRQSPRRLPQAPYSVDSLRWKLLKHRDNVRVFKERASFRETCQRQQNSNGNVAPERNGLASEQQPALPMMMGIGSVQGSVDDVMYGLLNYTQDMATIRASYVGDDVVDSQVLTSLTCPSGSEPLRSLSVKWCVKRHHGIIRSLVRYRDFVFIEATGVTRDQNGERMGYHVIHSITVPGVRELHEMNVVRAQISMCCLFRQRDANAVEVFMRGFLNPLGDVPLSTAMASAAESVLSVWKAIYCAQMKKLAWGVASAASTSQRREKRTVDSCELCWKGLRASLHSTKQCQVCRRYLCSRCRVPKKLNFLSSVASPAHLVVQKSVLFCSCCVYKATKLSSLELAVRESTAAHEALEAHTVTTVSPGSATSGHSQTPLPTPKSTRSCASSVSSNNYVSMPSGNSRRGGSRLSKWFG